MSDSVDRVFVHALATVRRLPRTGSSRPPPESRLRLYGLYKQSMEGDVEAILPRPTLPPQSPDSNGSSVARYASRDLRYREAQAEIEKWDAWNACKGMTRTHAKREYITTLIDTMKAYASGTPESRELVGELEFVWHQIRSQSGSDEEGTGSSPERRLQRAGLAQTRHAEDQSRRQMERTQSGLRVLSPVSQHDSDPESVIRSPEAERPDGEHQDTEDEALLQTAPSSPSQHHSVNRRRSSHQHTSSSPHDDATNSRFTDWTQWQQSLSSQLHHLSTEVAALREQLSSNYLLSASTYNLGASYYALTPWQRRFYRTKYYSTLLGKFLIKQAVVQTGILLLVMTWGRWKGDLRVEEWVTVQLGQFRRKLGVWLATVFSFIMTVFGREGLWPVRFLRRILRLT